MRFLLFPVLSLLLLVAGCSGDASPTRPAARLRRDTYVVLLDLSDRVLQPGQVARDTALLGQVLATFRAGVARKLFVGSADRVKVVVAPQASYPAAILALSQGLELDLGQVPLAQRRQLAAPLQRLRHQVARLYEAASQDRSPRHYAGADLWHYFRDQLALDFPASPDYDDHNHLLVLTDGYLDFEDYHGHRQTGHRYASTRFVPELARQGEQWTTTFESGRYGLLPLPSPCSPALQHLQVVVAEVQPHAEYHLDILRAVWQRWLRESGLPTPQVLPHTDLSAVRAQLARW